MISFRRTIYFGILGLIATVSSLWGQLPPVKTDPLHPAKTIQGEAGCTATEASSCAQAAAKIMPIVMGESPLEGNLRRLTDEIGGRVSGSPEYTKAVAWGIAGFRAARVDVHTEKFMLPVAWSEGASRLELNWPGSILRIVCVGGMSPATPDGGIEAPLVNVGYGTEAEFVKAGAAVKGAILVVNTDIGLDVGGFVQRIFAAAGNYRPSDSRRSGSDFVDCGARTEIALPSHEFQRRKIEKIPQAVLAREDALRHASAR